MFKRQRPTDSAASASNRGSSGGEDIHNFLGLHLIRDLDFASEETESRGLRQNTLRNYKRVRGLVPCTQVCPWRSERAHQAL